MSQTRTVGIFIFPDVEVLDFCGPFEVFAITRSGESLDDAERLFDVYTIAEENQTVRCRGGLLVEPHYTIDNHPPLDILVVPGGWGVRTEMNNARLLDWIGDQGRRVETLTSVCTGAMLLGRAGLLDGKRATTHWKSLGWMRESFLSLQ